MTKPKATAKPAAKPAPSSPAPARRTDAALQPASPLEVLVSRALDQELEWYFAYSEAALLRQNVGILPSYAAVRVLATEPTDEACRVKALELAATVRTCLASLQQPHASVLRAAYTPRRWPPKVQDVFDGLAPIVVRLAFADDPWPERAARTGLEEAAATRLSAALITPSRVPVARLRAQAQRLLGAAIVAYAAARGEQGPALSVAAR
jgi:hypothetical protein